jgi:hypothetical protein
MKKIFLTVCIVANFNSIQAMENQKIRVDSFSTSPKDIIIAGIIAGGSIELVNLIFREERYKDVFRFIKRYPGVSVSGFSAVIGMGLIYAQTVSSLFNRLFKKTA